MLLLYLCEELLEESQSQLKISKSTLISESQLPQGHLGRSIYVEILFEQIW